ncbi:MAG: hypothetical protein COB40_06875 [Marinosulfonomonas sp.]|nr:MAG: hypothetical protein COB40_06875 [Marinosulfonomonas sp.]
MLKIENQGSAQETSTLTIGDVELRNFGGNGGVEPRPTACWKASSQGADGYLLSEVEGAPYWSDALGQIPFAADTYRDFRQRGYNHQRAAELTARRGAQFSEGKILRGVGAFLGITKPDTSNSYDNAIIARTTSWASGRWSFSTYGVNGRYRKTNSGVSYKGLAY